jgi:hypothetical protein
VSIIPEGILVPSEGPLVIREVFKKVFIMMFFSSAKKRKSRDDLLSIHPTSVQGQDVQTIYTEYFGRKKVKM